MRAGDRRPVPPPPARPEPAIANRGEPTPAVPLEELIATGAVERIAANPNAARLRLRDAPAHLRTARRNLRDDPRGAVSLAHQAARKAITAHMLVHGYRTTGGEGGHRHVISYAVAELRAVVDPVDLDLLERIRRDRNRADYGDDAAILTPEHAEAAVAGAARVVAAVTRWFESHHPDLVPAEPPAR